MRTALVLIVGITIGVVGTWLYEGSEAERAVTERRAQLVGSFASDYVASQSEATDPRARVKTVAGLHHIPIEVQHIDENILRASGVANAWLIRTDDGVILFDTGLGTQAATQKRLLQEHAAGPVTHIILSHSHADHIGGTRFWKREFPDARIIAHERFAEGQRYLKELEPYFWSRNRLLYTFMPETPPDESNLFHYGGVIPDITVRDGDRYVFESGGIEFVVLPAPGAEGDDNIVLWLPDRGALFSGDFFGPLFPMVPNLFTLRGEKFRDPLAYVRSLTQLIELAPERVLPSHFDPVVGRDEIAHGMRAMQQATKFIHNETVAGMNAGKSLWQLMDEVQLPPELSLSEGHGKVSWNVRSIWEYYSTWFHFESTTELYNVPVRTLYPELAEFSGRVRLLELSAARMEHGALEQALHLIEIAEASEGPDPASLQLRIDVLNRLLDRAYETSSNFSETGWLRRQIEISEAQLAQLGE